MTKQQKQKLIIVYSAVAIFIGCCFWLHDPCLQLLSAGFILGFMANEIFFRQNDERR